MNHQLLFSALSDGSTTNPKYHSTCHVPSDPNSVIKVPVSARRSQSRASLPPNFTSNSLLTHSDLTMGEKLYLANIAKVYNAQPMIKQKQEQYRQILFQQRNKGTPI